MTDVTCRVIVDQLDYFRHRGLDSEPVVAELRRRIGPSIETSLTFLSDPVNRVSWDTYVAFSEVWAEALGVPGIERDFIETSIRQGNARWASVLKPLLQLLTSPQQIYWFTNRFGGPMNFRNIQAETRKLGPDTLEVQLSLRPQDRDCALWFRLVHEAFRRIPMLVGYQEAIVEAELTGRTGRYVITMPPSLSLWARLRRRFGAAFRPRALFAELFARDEQVRLTYQRLFTAQVELEEKVRQRTLDLERANAELHRRVEALKQVEKIAHLGNWEWKPSQERVAWSDETYRIFGIEPVGSPITFSMIAARVHPEDRSRIDASTARAQQEGGRFENDHRIVRPDGTVRHVHQRGEVVHDADGSTRLIGTVHDVTLQKEYERSLIAAKEAADAANRTKTTFLASISHEIRTPMTSVLGFADLLAREELPAPKRQAYVEKILRNGRHLLTLIDDILDLSKIEAGHLVIQAGRFAPASEIAQAIDILREQAEKKGLALLVERATPFPESMVSDQIRFRQILLNLIGNAIKFTDQGQVLVAARRDGEHLEIDVRDTGLGIAPEHQEALFQPFSQANVLAARPRGGSGLGLALARNLARALGGDVLLLDSRRGYGSTFRARLKLELEPSPLVGKGTVAIGGGLTLQLDETGGVAGFPGGTRVLVVEDNADIQEIVRRVLESIGAKVTTAGNGEECLTLAAGQTFDLVVMDMQMPVLDGFQATRRLRQRGFDRPIVAITAFAMSGEREKCLAAGCNDFLPKPVEALSLIRTVARWSTAKREAEA